LLYKLNRIYLYVYLFLYLSIYIYIYIKENEYDFNILKPNGSVKIKNFNNARKVHLYSPNNSEIGSLEDFPNIPKDDNEKANNHNQQDNNTKDSNSNTDINNDNDSNSSITTPVKNYSNTTNITTTTSAITTTTTTINNNTNSSSNNNKFDKINDGNLINNKEDNDNVTINESNKEAYTQPNDELLTENTHKLSERKR